MVVAFVAGVVVGVVAAVLHEGENPMAPLPVQQAPSSSPGSSQFGEIKKKVDLLQSILKNDPENLNAWIDLGNAYFDTDQFDAAIEAYSKALEIDPKKADVRTDMGIMYRRKGDFDRAIQEFRKAAEDDPGHLNSRYNLGVVLLHDKGDIPGAIEAWEKYLKLEPNGRRAENIRNQITKMKAMTK